MLWKAFVKKGLGQAAYLKKPVPLKYKESDSTGLTYTNGKRHQLCVCVCVCVVKIVSFIKWIYITGRMCVKNEKTTMLLFVFLITKWRITNTLEAIKGKQKV